MTAFTEVGPEALGNRFRFGQRQPWHGTVDRPSTGDRSGHVHVHVWDGLVGGYAVVLPHNDPGGIERGLDRAGGPHGSGHERMGFLTVEVEDGLPVNDGNDEYVTEPPLLPGDEQRADVITAEDGVGPTAVQVGTERTLVDHRALDGHRLRTFRVR